MHGGSSPQARRAAADRWTATVAFERVARAHAVRLRAKFIDEFAVRGWVAEVLGCGVDEVRDPLWLARMEAEGKAGAPTVEDLEPYRQIAAEAMTPELAFAKVVREGEPLMRAAEELGVRLLTSVRSRLAEASDDG